MRKDLRWDGLGVGLIYLINRKKVYKLGIERLCVGKKSGRRCSYKDVYRFVMEGFDWKSEEFLLIL